MCALSHLFSKYFETAPSNLIVTIFKKNNKIKIIIALKKVTLTTAALFLKKMQM